MPKTSFDNYTNTIIALIQSIIINYTNTIIAMNDEK